MKIISIEVENIKRLSAAYVTTLDGEPIVTIGGKNGAGKSSLLDAIAMALGGKKLCPAQPIRKGQTKGHVAVDLGAYVVTRRFWRKGEDIESTLVVTTPDGADYKSPQALLDKLVSDLTFDPLAFLDLQPAAQREYVRVFVGLDFTALDARRKTALVRADEARGVVKMADRDVGQSEHYPDTPTAQINIAQLLAALADAERLEKAATKAEQAVTDKRRALELSEQSIKEWQATVERLKSELAHAETAVVSTIRHRDEIVTAGKTCRTAADIARGAVPNTIDLRQQLGAANVTNTRVQANVRYAAIVASRDEAYTALKTAQDAIKAIDAEKLAALAQATFPVAGLAFSDDGLTFNDLPFEQASYAEQLRVAVAMGLASNPKLKVLLIKHGSALDVTSLRLLAQLADEAGAQCWIERVAETPDGMSVWIEDGTTRLAEAVL